MAGRYAQALFELALDQGILDAIAGDLQTLKRLLATSPALKRLVLSPVFDRDAQMRGIGAVAARAEFDALTQKFLGLLAQNRRLFALERMIDVFTALAARQRGEMTAAVTVAQSLNPAQTQKLGHVLREVFHSDIQMEIAVDAALLGGMVVRVGSQMFDASLATRLHSLQLAMREA